MGSINGLKSLVDLLTKDNPDVLYTKKFLGITLADLITYGLAALIVIIVVIIVIVKSF